VGGVGGIGAYNNPETTDALIRHRDGIVGAWQAPAVPGAGFAHPLDSDGPFELWEPWCRAAILDVELLSHVQLTRNDEQLAFVDSSGTNITKTVEQFTLWNLKTVTSSAVPAVTAERIASMVRPTLATFTAQLALVEAYSDLREDRASEILSQMTPQYAFWSSVTGLHPTRMRWTCELLEAALRLANFVEMRFKQALACRRPHEYSPQIQPMIQAPGHGSLPSGHSTEAHAVAYVLCALRRVASSSSTPATPPLLTEQLMRQAARIAINRTVAGLHFPVDSAAGQLLGLTLGEYLVARCTGAAFDAWRFNGEAYPEDLDFDFRNQFDTAHGVRKTAAYAGPLTAGTADLAPRLSWLWKKAQAEWA